MLNKILDKFSDFVEKDKDGLYLIQGTDLYIFDYNTEKDSLILLTNIEPLNGVVSFKDIKKLEEIGITITGVGSEIDGTLTAKIN